MTKHNTQSLIDTNDDLIRRSDVIEEIEKWQFAYNLGRNVALLKKEINSIDAVKGNSEPFCWLYSSTLPHQPNTYQLSNTRLSSYGAHLIETPLYLAPPLAPPLAIPAQVNEALEQVLQIFDKWVNDDATIPDFVNEIRALINAAPQPLE